MTAIDVLLADITALDVDVVVNAANADLAGGGGVDGAIHRAAGPTVLAECREVIARRGRLSAGEVEPTGAGDLPARWVFHAVGPIWGTADPEVQDRQLADCYRCSISLAAELGASSVAFPNISTGVYAYPRERAAHVAVEAVLAATRDSAIERIVFACFDQENLDLTRSALEELR
jgi:O-acetyl-ADP-ribose deacetylase (regulator of RNase III)